MDPAKVLLEILQELDELNRHPRPDPDWSIIRDRAVQKLDELYRWLVNGGTAPDPTAVIGEFLMRGGGR